MSRVQKGCAVFKPVAKARPRPATVEASRQASVALDVSTELLGSIATGTPSFQTSMQPPKQKSSNAPGETTPVVHPTIPSAVPLSESSQQPFAAPAAQSEQRTAPLAPNITAKSVAPSRGTLLSVPSRASATPIATPIAIGIPRPPTQAVVPVPELSLPPTTQSTTSVIMAPNDRHLSDGSPPQEPESQTADKQRRTRKRRRSTATPDGDDDASSTSSKAKSGRGRRSRGPSLPPYDPTADPGEDLDPTVVTMATLCNDTGQGRVSSKAAEILSNHAAWKKQNREKRARMRELMEARKYGRTEQEAEILQENGVPPTPPPITPSTSQASTSASTDDPNADFDYTQDLAASRFNVQVRIGPNGETVIDEESLVVNREEPDETANYTHVTESDTTKFINSGTYAKRFRGSRWSAEETELFYDALMQHGENYELIAYMLPGRDRKSCKNKFKVEDKRNPARINYCLNNRTAPDIEYLSRMTGKDFSGPVPEIRAPPRPAIIPPPEVPQEASQEAATTKRKRRTKTTGPEEGLVIIGDADAMGSESS
ncbi:hypothetical protein MD484_g6135, partial [Candolleomyces efflorescens]